MIPRVIAGTIFVAVLCLALGSTTPDISDEPLARTEQRALQPTPIPTRGDAANGTLVRELQLYSADRGALSRADELRLTVGTYDTSPSLAAALLAVGPSCAFRGDAQRLRENEPLRLVRPEDCRAAEDAGPVTLTLTFNASSAVDARAALWTVPSNGAEPLLLSVDPESRTRAVVARRIVLRSAARSSRASLLAFMWDLPGAAVWALALAGAALFVFGGTVAPGPGPWPAFRTAFTLAGGLALCYAVVVPPLQAPDEPDHLLSFAALRQRPDLAAATSAWAKRIHFHRITFVGDERFTPRDRDEPFDRDWPPLEIFAENVPRRSSTTTRQWQVMAPFVPSNPAHALLLFRLSDAVIFAAAIAAGAAFLSAWSAHQAAGGIAPVLLLVPTLPFFGMHMSELAFTLGAFILTGYAALVLSRAQPARYTGTVLGIATALIAAGPRNGWPALLIIAGLCAARIAARLTTAERPGTDTWWFWGGLALPGIVLFASGLLWVPVPFYEQWQFGGFDPRGGVSAMQFILPLTAGAIAGAVAERLAGLVAPVRAAAILARSICAAAAAGIVVCLAWSMFAPLPQLLAVESGPAPSAGEYVWSVIRTLATAARVRDFDFLTWTSLWGGFGWINPILPSLAIGAVTIVVSLAATMTLLAYARDKEGRAAVVAVCVVAGIVASVAAAALSSFGLNRNLHGRYLIAGCVVGMCLLVAPSLIAGNRRIIESARSAALFACICALHGYALRFVVVKYFG